MEPVKCPECECECYPYELEDHIVCTNCYCQKGAVEREALAKKALAILRQKDPTDPENW